jgi:hypothetical protein
VCIIRWNIQRGKTSNHNVSVLSTVPSIPDMPETLQRKAFDIIPCFRNDAAYYYFFLLFTIWSLDCYGHFLVFFQQQKQQSLLVPSKLG